MEKTGMSKAIAVTKKQRAARKSAKHSEPASKDPLLRWEIFTPAMAAQALEHNKGNRGHHQPTSDRYARDMAAERWYRSPDCLAFDEEGNLQNGQHRLRGQVKSGRTIKYAVMRGLRREECVVMDGGKLRSTRDASNYTPLVGIDGLMLSVAQAMYFGYEEARRTTIKLSRHELFEIVENHYDAIRQAIDYLRPKQRSITIMPVIAVFARAAYSVEAELLARCGQVLVHGAPADGTVQEADRAMITLRTWLLNHGAVRGGARGAHEKYAKASRALWAAANGESLGKVYSATQELFELPEESVPTIKRQSRLKQVRGGDE